MQLIRLLTPSLRCARRRYLAQNRGVRGLIAPLAITLFAILLTWCVYDGLALIHSKLMVLSLPPIIWLLPLGALFFILFFTTALVHTTTSLYLSEDLPLLLASPLNYRTIFILKMSDVFILSASITCSIFIPPLLGIGLYYNAGILFYLIALATLIPLAITALGIAATIVIFITSVLPAKRAREIFLIAVTFLLLATYLVIKFSGEDVVTTIRADALLNTSHLFFDPIMPWYWFATICSDFAGSTQRGQVDIPLIALCLLAVSSLGFAYIFSLFLYERGLIRTSQFSARRSIVGKVKNRFFNRVQQIIQALLPGYLLAMFKKEMTVLVRDMAQAVQLFLILGVCLIYLYNVRIFSSIEADPSVSLWWRGTLLVITFSMSALVLIALTSRFIFPSVSLEGRALWILQTSPLTALQWLRAKQLSWWIPSSCISVVLFCSGGFAIDLDLKLITLLLVLGIITSYGLAALGVGLGAIYSEFNWEHHSQIASSFGNFVFIITGFIWIGLLSMVFFLAIMVSILWEIGLLPDELSAILSLSSLSLLFLWLNLWITRFILQLGAAHITNLTLKNS